VPSSHVYWSYWKPKYPVPYSDYVSFFVFDEDEVSCADDDPDVEYLEDTCMAWEQVRHEVQSATGDIATDHQMSDHL
jgi:hypothetical protein